MHRHVEFILSYYNLCAIIVHLKFQLENNSPSKAEEQKMLTTW